MFTKKNVASKWLVVATVMIMLFVTGVHATPNLLVLEANRVLEYNVDGGGYVGVWTDTSIIGVSANRAMAWGPNGNLFITNTNTNSVLEFDKATGVFIGQYGDTGVTGAGKSAGIRDLNFDSAGNLYVADYSDGVIRKYNAAGAYVGTLTDSTGAMTSGPMGLAIDDADTLYANLWNNNSNPGSVLKFDGVDTFTSLNTGAAYAVKQGIGMAYHDGNVYPVSAAYGGARKLSTDGTIQGNYVFGTGQITVVDITFDDLGNGYLAAVNSHDVKRFAANGAYIDTPIASGINPVGVLFIPEPGTILLLGLGFAAICKKRRQQEK